MSQYTTDDSLNFSHNFNTNSFNVWHNYATDDRSQLLAWLSPLEPKLRHRDIQERRVDNVGEWLVQTEEFRRWYDGSGGEGDSAVLFCYGNPGVGKTFISSLVVDRLHDEARGQNTVVTCFYHDFAAREEQSTASMLGSLLKQAIGGMEGIPEEISRAFQEQKKAIGGCGPQLVDMVKMLQEITSVQTMVMCIDGLDECLGVQRAKLFDSLNQILEKSPGTRIFATGRPYIRAEVERRLAGHVASVSIGSIREDIITYIRARLREDETPDAMDKSLEADILEKIPENISEMFLLVSLNIDAILKESTIYRRREKLRNITDGLGLGDAYGATIERIMAQDGDKSRLGMAALIWISHAERPFKADELCHALSVELGLTEIDASNVPSMSTLLGCCQGLITVDKKASTVRLIHFTLKEYLSARPDIFDKPHSAMAEICLTYLNSKQVKALSAYPHPEMPDAPFLEYCSLYWGVHAKKELSDNARSLALELFRDYDGHISTKWLLKHAGYLDLRKTSTSLPFSGLHCASFFGIVELVAALIEMECYDINAGDFWGYAPLTWAARNGHWGAVEILAEREVINPNKPDKYGRTPLSHASSRGHEKVVRILLRREGINPEKPDNKGRTPLACAAWNGHEGVVKMLVGQAAVNPNRPDKSGRTPLSHAAGRGHKEVVEILLEREQVSRDKADKDGRTPLSYAAQYGNEGAVRALLGWQAVSPDKQDIGVQTQLSCTSCDGVEGAAKILPRREAVDSNKADTFCQTPLWHAASSGHEGVVKILLGQQEVDPNRPNNAGQTPLTLAAWNGHEGVVKTLLGRAEIDPDRPDNYGRTPLSYAARHGHCGAVRMLIGREEVDPNKPDNHGQTPLTSAARWGHQTVLALLEAHQAATCSPILRPKRRRLEETPSIPSFSERVADGSAPRYHPSNR